MWLWQLKCQSLQCFVQYLQQARIADIWKKTWSKRWKKFWFYCICIPCSLHSSLHSLPKCERRETSCTRCLCRSQDHRKCRCHSASIAQACASAPTAKTSLSRQRAHPRGQWQRQHRTLPCWLLCWCCCKGFAFLRPWFVQKLLAVLKFHQFVRWE